MGHYDYEYVTLTDKEVSESIENFKLRIKNLNAEANLLRKDKRAVDSVLVKMDIDDRIRKVENEIKEVKQYIKKYEDALNGGDKVKVMEWT